MTGAFLALAALMVGSALWLMARPLWQAGETPATPPQRSTASVLALLLVAAVVAGYAAVGEPRAWLDPDSTRPAARVEAAAEVAPEAAPETPAPDADNAGIGPAQIEAMVSRLAQRLQSQPDDVEGWRMLARSYETLRRFDEAAHAYQRVVSLREPDADLLVDYAVALGMSKGQTLAGEPEALLDEALKREPKHPQALALSGSAAFERQDYARAIERWRKLLALSPPDAEMRASIQANIDKATRLSGKP